MADVIARSQAQAFRADPAGPRYDLIELLFFAYRDFVQEADAVLERYGFGRAHHRVLHFVSRNPGLKVAELLTILKITKQSLGRVLRDLVEQGFVEANEGEHDRRQRLLRVTPRGEKLALELATLQTKRIETALAGAGPGAHDAAVKFLTAMINGEERDAVARLVANAS
ncbi:transcriptional regulator [Terrihabitans soli]|uniref:Transcriptional regulator n=1 Tax=Terrihabitans soli TaxID=708113 RepID=A0A6S6QS66_9HYPH|nr:MarR family transcriptional regulator [Terrihabitans soli]BCJ90122.1 transcriptional regulator [Terrihabitans soli]